MALQSWLDLEDRFRELAPKLADARLDAQWGAAGEYWRLACHSPDASAQEFQLLCALGGSWLAKALPRRASDGSTLMAEPDTKHRWFKALKLFGGHFSAEMVGTQADEKGDFCGHIYSAHLYHPAVHCANLCLNLQAQYPIPERTVWRKLWDEYGSKIVLGAIGTILSLLLALGFKLIFG